MEKQTGVIFCIIRDSKVLMQQRDGNCKKYPFMWCIPGGSSEAGESHGQTLLREVKEEYNIDLNLKQCKYLMDYNEGADKVFFCKINQNQEPVLREGLSMKWMTISEIENTTLGFQQKGIIPTLKNYLF